MNVDRYRERRARVLQAMAELGGGVAVHFTAPERMRNRDSEYPYRYDSTFWYLTGFAEPDSAIVLIAHGARREALLFCRDKHEEREIWDGFRYGPELAQAVFGFDAAHAIERIDEVVPDLMADAPALFYALGRDPALDGRVRDWLRKVRAQSRTGRRAPATAHDLAAIVDDMRLVKDADEIATMRRAAHISAAAHARAMRACRVGMREYEIEAELLHEFRRQGAQSPAYTSIVAAGANACVLHYPAGHAEAKDGDLVLIDAACEIDGYAADITRTFPANGRFTAEQRAVYEVVLAAQHAAIEAVRPGADFNAPHEVATRILTQGLIDLGLLSGSLDGAIESKSFRQFFMHKTGHWLGLDVHDVGDYRQGVAVGEGVERPWRILAPGMVTTVEPGLYIRPAPNVEERFHHIGIRIEDDVAVSADGREVLSGDAPRLLTDIEAHMGR
ncbi:MAG: aminopeptidase P N-terminal domain-containing protein [Burkholderiaceae bacterium]|jgi:Xaa-Pro aminopeptidase|nr:aminopeptidase P N-terminal domain-containing protein [Burkholderiaceae bacterium]